ncbi:MAG: TetR/AcrR family transcriptional regulator [Actinobacteria bacterium]|nr:TetR/AcrR family transcriptional regulator [Actinomycetota bacterium]
MSNPSPPRPRALKPSQNREKLLQAARELMAGKGYSGTGTEEIVVAAGVTRGALYYQFVDKRDLFRALCESLWNEVATRIFEETMAGGVAEVDELAVGSALLLDCCSEPEIRQLLLIDGPAVLGAEEWRALQAPVSLGLLRHALEHQVSAGRIPADQLEPLADMLFGALCQAGIAMGNAQDPERVRRSYQRSIDALLVGIGASSTRRVASES